MNAGCKEPVIIHMVSSHFEVDVTKKISIEQLLK